MVNVLTYCRHDVEFKVRSRVHTVDHFGIQWNPSIMDTIGNNIFSQGVPNLGFQCISGRHGMHNHAVEHNVAVFSELSLPVRWPGRLSRG